MSSSFFVNPKAAKKGKKKIVVQDDYSFISGTDSVKTDGDYSIPHIPEYAGGEMGRSTGFDARQSTSLEKLGISSIRREPICTVVVKEKIQIKSYMTMKDITTGGVIPQSTDIPCYGCHRRFTTMPIGIPLAYYPSIYTSANDATRIKRLTSRECREMTGIVADQITQREYFDTEGIVCSFNCILSCIESSPSVMYERTHSLIPKLYSMIFGEYPRQKIIRSPSWKMRSEYGGPLTDEEFVSVLQTVQFTNTHQCLRIQRLFNPQPQVFTAVDINLELATIK